MLAGIATEGPHVAGHPLADGDVASVTDSVNGTWNYTYDDFNRLIAASCSTGCPDGQSALAFTYDYDLYGNRWH